MTFEEYHARHPSTDKASVWEAAKRAERDEILNELSQIQTHMNDNAVRAVIDFIRSREKVRP